MNSSKRTKSYTGSKIESGIILGFIAGSIMDIIAIPTYKYFTERPIKAQIEEISRAPEVNQFTEARNKIRHGTDILQDAEAYAALSRLPNVISLKESEMELKKLQEDRWKNKWYYGFILPAAGSIAGASIGITSLIRERRYKSAQN